MEAEMILLVQVADISSFKNQGFPDGVLNV